ncbi:hypothetical protein [Streptomyces roseolus]|uniref:hypothetical protein n=1 Tax=Streptomyces roseolus TaxID=67358 RepID=UPI001673AB71|nr:hypothetical protein [Streptomyces roseolus]GGR28051.1 hypothetical protein GCM10010282_20480 [Streptomyces roseolus]
MRPLAARRLAALAIPAVLALGTAGPALADEHRPSRAAADRAARAPLPDVAALPARTRALADVGGVTVPVTELVAAALKADDGRIPAADADALKAKIQAAVDRAGEAAPAPLPETPAAPPVVNAPVSPPAGGTPVSSPAVESPAGLPAKPPVTLSVAAGSARAAPADPVGAALGTVEKAVAGLLAAAASGDAAGVAPQATATLTSLVDLAVATVLGSGLPAPDLPGLPALPALPAEAPELPVDPPAEAPEPPVDVPVKPPLPVR